MGIIPTRMGTRSEVVFKPCVHGDHPHAYGDKRSFAPFVSLSIGSSPRVWGQVLLADFCVCENRIIPTRMGTSRYRLYG